VKSPSGENNITAEFLIILTVYFSSEIWRKGQYKVLEKKECCTYRDQFPVVSQQNIANNFSLFRDILVS
jgi:hypothetical protein